MIRNHEPHEGNKTQDYASQRFVSQQNWVRRQQHSVFLNGVHLCRYEQLLRGHAIPTRFASDDINNAIPLPGGSRSSRDRSDQKGHYLSRGALALA